MEASINSNQKLRPRKTFCFLHYNPQYKLSFHRVSSIWLSWLYLFGNPGLILYQDSGPFLHGIQNSSLISNLVFYLSFFHILKGLGFNHAEFNIILQIHPGSHVIMIFLYILCSTFFSIGRREEEKDGFERRALVWILLWVWALLLL